MARARHPVPDFRSPTGSFSPHIPNTAQKGLHSCTLNSRGNCYPCTPGTVGQLLASTLTSLEMAGLLFAHSCYSGGGLLPVLESGMGICSPCPPGMGRAVRILVWRLGSNFKYSGEDTL